MLATGSRPTTSTMRISARAARWQTQQLPRAIHLTALRCFVPVVMGAVVSGRFRCFAPGFRNAVVERVAKRTTTLLWLIVRINSTFESCRIGLDNHNSYLCFCFKAIDTPRSAVCPQENRLSMCVYVCVACSDNQFTI